MTIEGVPIVFDTPAIIDDPAGKYTEIIQRGALDGADLSECRLFYNHDMNRVPLAKSPHTMRFETTPQGLQMTAELPDTEAAREVYTAVKRGDLSGMSFAFNDAIIAGLLAAAPGYIEVATGIPGFAQRDIPIVEVITKFLIQLWYNPDGTDTEKLQHVINNLLKSLSRMQQ